MKECVLLYLFLKILKENSLNFSWKKRKKNASGSWVGGGEPAFSLNFDREVRYMNTRRKKLQTETIELSAVFRFF